MVYKIFISSSHKEFVRERHGIRDLIAHDPFLRKFFKVILLEDSVMPGSSVLKTSANLIESSDVFIVLVGKGHDADDRSEVSYLQREYGLIRATKKPCLVFIKGSRHLSSESAAQAFIRVIQQDEIVYRRFLNWANLEQYVFASLVKFLKTVNAVQLRTEQEQERALLESSGGSSAKVFLVHGRDEKAKLLVARFLRKLVPQVIILSEQASKGKTVIEKFEHYSDVGCAVVLLTGDDRGGLVGTPTRKLMLRARQNVIFELGYFIGKIGRAKVVALYRPGVEIPSDYVGVTYIFFDKGGRWKNTLALEIKSAGVGLDANALLK
jgi:predicted nucleotide-binding protein